MVQGRYSGSTISSQVKRHRRENFSYSLFQSSRNVWSLIDAPLFSISWCRTIGPHQSPPSGSRLWELSSIMGSDLSPQSDCDGFFYFKLPNGIERLENLRVEVTSTEEQTGNQLSYKFTLPTLNLR